MPNDRAHWWSTVVEPYLRSAGTDDWLDDSFVITELHVHPGFQGRGIGRALITAITDTAAEPRSILSAIDTESPGPRPLPLPGLPRTWPARSTSPAPPKPYAVMGAPLPLLRPAPVRTP